jgi:hypothetical protein
MNVDDPAGIRLPVLRSWLARLASGGAARATLARRAAAAFDLDADLVSVGPPDAGVFGAGAIPHDTRLDAAHTAAALGAELPDLTTTLARLRAELETAWSHA